MREAPVPRCWRQTFNVKFADLDAGGLASTLAVWRWLQEAAGEHARAAGVAAEGDRGVAWVLTDLRLKVDRYPAAGEQVTVETWPAARLAGARGYRDFSLHDADGRPLGVGASLWLLLDLATRRPLRLPEQVTALRAQDRAPVELPDAPLAAAPRREDPGHARVAHWHDLDVNGHVTNARLVAWLLDAAPLEVWQGLRPAMLSVRFAGEVRAGERVLARCAWEGAQAPSRHAILGEGGEVRAVAAVRWAPVAHGPRQKA